MSSLRSQINTRSGVRSFLSSQGLTHFVNEEHAYAAFGSADPKLAATKEWYTQGKGRPPYSIEYMLKQGDKDPRNYLGQGFQKTQQDGNAINQAILDQMNDPSSPVSQSLAKMTKSMLQNGFQAAFDPTKRKRARANQTNNGMGPQGNYNGPSEEVTPGLPEFQLPYYTGENMASRQMKKNQFADRAMENGGPAQVNSYASTPGWYTMDKRVGIPTASGGYNVPNYNPETNKVEVRHYGHGFPTYMSNPNVNVDMYDDNERTR